MLFFSNIYLGAFEIEDEATDFVRCKIESLYANKVDPFKEGKLSQNAYFLYMVT